MKSTLFGTAVTLLALLVTAPVQDAWALGTAFTYQGQLAQSGLPVDGTCDFQFSLWDAAGSGSPPSGGSQVGGSLFVLSEVVTKGLFTVALDYGDGIFTGPERWLQIAVRCPAGSGSYTTLTPRQKLTATPHALYARDAGTALVAVDLSCSGCVGSGEIGPLAITGAQILSGTIEKSNLAFTPGSVTEVDTGPGLTGGPITTSGQIDVDFGTDPGTVAEGNHNHDAKYWSLTGNAGTVPGTMSGQNFLGTVDDQALDLAVGNARAFRLEPGDTPNIVGGWSANSVLDGAVGVTIGGGGKPGDGGMPQPNTVATDYAVVAGGFGNQAGIGNGTADEAWGATVGGGLTNLASGAASAISGGVHNIAAGEWTAIGGGQGNQATAKCATISGGCASDSLDPTTSNRVTDDFGTIGGGEHNLAGDNLGATTDATHATVCGGGGNIAAALGASVGGGGGNQATGEYSTVPGGALNFATGAGSLAAGRGSFAVEDGTFIWGDGTLPAFSQGANSFTALATGGFHFFFSGGNCTLTNATGWQCAGVSDRNLKTNVTPVDPREVLERLATVPIRRWSYIGQDASIRHLGPMAQDFHAAFQVGENDRQINTIDASGVSFAAIQGLYQILRQKEAEIAALQREKNVLDARVTALEKAIGLFSPPATRCPGRTTGGRVASASDNRLRD